MAVNLSPYGGVGAQFLDNSGNVLTGGKVYTYAAGTTTPQVTYSNSAGTTPHSNPIVLDASGRVPTGEIWLTDGLAYKFVLKDSNDVLIATYDYISGINSNFVAYTNQQEIQTATAGQTVFTLTTATYQPGTNSLSVFVDGVNQYGPGSSYAYLETSSNTVTFVTGLHVGAEVKFTTSQLNSSGGNDAYNVSYLPPFTGAVATNVGLKLAQTVSFKDFGAVGDGITDDTVAIQAAISASSGCVIDGGNLTYKITSTITGFNSNQKIQNATFDFSSLPDTGSVDRCFSAVGTLGSYVSLTSNTAVNSGTVIVGNTSTFTANQLVFIRSNAYWSTSLNIQYGQYARIKSVDSSTQITLYDNVLMDFNTTDSAQIAPVTPIKNLTFENVKIIGRNLATMAQAGIYLEYCEDANIIRCNFEYIDYVSVALSRCYNSTIDGCRQRYANNAGTSYAYAIWSGSYACSVINSWGEDCRHTVTIGGSSGTAGGICIHTKIIGNHASGSKSAGFDSHVNSMYTEYIGNHVEMSKNQFLTSSHDGIICEGLHSTIIGNTIVDTKGHGIIHSNRVEAPYTGSTRIADNTIIQSDTGFGTGNSSQGIYVLTTQNSSSFDSVVISNNTIKGNLNNIGGGYGIYVYAFATSSIIKNVVVANNISADFSKSASIFIRTGGASTTLSNVIISNNVAKSSGSQNIYILADGTSSSITNISGGNNIFEGTGSNIGIYINASVGTISNVNFGSNTYKDVDAAFLVATNLNVSNILFADSILMGPITYTASTGTISYKYNNYIINYGGTATLTLPNATTSKGRVLNIKTITANAVNSASSNVVPIDSATAGTSILPATDGAWATLYCDGTNWVITQKG